MTPSGVCTQMAAMVPTTTIMNAAAEMRPCSPAPFSTAPTITAARPRNNPVMLRMSVSGSCENGEWHAFLARYMPRSDSRASMSACPFTSAVL